MTDFDRLGDLLGGATPERRSTAARLAEVWPSAVGEEIARHAVPSSFRGGKLIVAASSPSWAQTLQLMGPKLIERLNESLGEGEVRQIVVRTAGWPGAGSLGPDEEPVTPEGSDGTGRRVEPPALSEEEQAAVAQVELTACDPVLGARLAGLMRATLLRNRGRRSG